ncbi:MAG: sensor histidine kinase [Hasllibacter sp.]
MLRTLSGRFLILSAAFVMLAEVLIFVPSIARYREEWLLSRLEAAQIAALSVIAGDDMIDAALERELLETAGVYNVVLQRDRQRQLILASPVPGRVAASYDLRTATALTLIRDAFARLADPEDELIRVVGSPVREAGMLIDVTLDSGPLRMAMIDYGLRILWLSLVISLISAGLLFLAVRRVLVLPIRRVTGAMARYAAAPEDARALMEPTATTRELREAEEALRAMQEEVTQALRQKDRLAQLGSAVSKVSHDLRNILTTAQLFLDRVEGSEDPMVRRAAPRIVRALERAINLCEGTLAFGRAEEPAPRLAQVPLAPLVAEVVDGERLASGEAPIAFREDIPLGLTIRADGEQIIRVLTNLVRNARQALQAAGGGEVAIAAGEGDADWWIEVRDDGPGLPPKAQENLFAAFKGQARKGGTGLGLAIAAELVRGHGGTLRLTATGEGGTTFTIRLPKRAVLPEPLAAE